MGIHLHWFLPTSGDGREIVGGWPADAVVRPPDIEYLAQIARSAEQLGFEAVLTPTYWFGEGVAPLLRRRGLLAGGSGGLLDSGSGRPRLVGAA
jgi:alkanesulfonate monooxygenase SsuD/methylene tetrahydromethanopterin reductase-like flavin-dependent oxidoreductase (luciferase family)